MKRVDSDALGVVNDALGLTGAGSAVTELSDGIVDQALNVVPIVRRGRTLAKSQGIFTGVFRNVHSGGGALSSQINPYDVGFDAELPPYPVPIPRQFDIWLLSATGRRVTGTGTVTASIIIRYSAVQQGWGISDTNTPVALLSEVPVALWSILFGDGTTTWLRDSNVSPNAPEFAIRLPRDRNLTLIFQSNVSAAATLVADLVLGVFPVSLGQDGRE